MRNLTILRSIGGSSLVIERSREHYIDVRRDVRGSRCDIAECVRNGHVYRKDSLSYGKEPEQIISLIKEELA